jgi:hypothetical protein
MGEQGFGDWIRARNNGRRTAEMSKGIIPLRIVLLFLTVIRIKGDIGYSNPFVFRQNQNPE